VTDAIREHGLKAIFVEPQFSSVAAERIAHSTGIRVLPIDPLGDGDWALLMRKNLDSLVSGLGGAASPAAAR
jgi:ABC-type Zn uptake system ZnuABC Zn-binding protein ZnuA